MVRTITPLLLACMFTLGLGFAAGRIAWADDSPSASRSVPLAGHTFGFQGRIALEGIPFNGACDLQFTMVDDSVPPAVTIGVTQTLLAQPVVNGLFSVVLNSGAEFDAGAIEDQARWLAVEARCPGGSGEYVSLGRQQITPAYMANALNLPVDQHVTSGDSGLHISNMGVGPAISGHGTHYGIFGSVGNGSSAGALPFSSAFAGTSPAWGVSVIGDLGGVDAYSPSANGLFASNSDLLTTSAAVRALTSSPNAAAVQAIGSGISVGSQGTAIEIQGGAVKVTGAGNGTATPVFIHEATVASTSGIQTCINHPLINGRDDAILLVTSNWTGAAVINPHPIAVSFGGVWCIFNLDGGAMPVGALFNVMVILP